MKLSKRILARTKTVEFIWAYKYFTQCTENYLKTRGRLSGKRQGTMTYCDWCKRKFELNEWIALASPKLKQEGPKRNWALCHDCADIVGAPDRIREVSK